MLKDPRPDGCAGFWLLHADDELLLFTAEDQSMVEAGLLAIVVGGCAGRYGMADGAVG
jgi:hypothetical protein